MRRCLTCNKVIKRGHGYKSTRKYCSKECWSNKPVKMVEAEKLYDKPIRDLIIDTLNQNKNVTLTADLLGVGKAQLYNWMEKLNIEKVLYWE